MYKLVLLALVIFLSGSIVNAASGSSKLLIIEVSTGNSQSASAEFVEIFNPNNNPIDLKDYKLEYKSASGSDWLVKANLEGKINTRGRFLMGTSVLGISNSQQIASGLASGGGHLRIVKDSQVLDQLGWGDADQAEAQPISIHAANQSIKRKVNEDGQFVDSNNNSLDFFLSDSPTPTFDQYEAVSINKSDTKAPVSGSKSQVSKPGAKQATLTKYPKINLSELLIDPESPQTDADDEFIEIYNPGKETVKLDGYQIQAGSTSWRYKYEIENMDIKAGQYLALFSSETDLTLSNAGSKVQILDPNGSVVDGVGYENAKEGVALAKIGEKWGWSETPTPSKPNSVAGVSQTGSTAEADPDESNFPQVDGSVSRDEAEQQKDDTSAEDRPDRTIDSSVLAIVGGLAILYGLYEYRQDIRSGIGKVRRYFKHRRKTGTATEGR